MKVGLSIFALAAVLAIGVSTPVSAHQVVVGKLKIAHPWVREAAEGARGTYSCIIEIQNDGDEPDRLLGATIEGAGTGVLYKLTENNGHFTSRPFEEGLVIKPHGSIELPPTAYQFKFGKITKALVADTMVNGTLVFEKLHSVPVELRDCHKWKSYNRWLHPARVSDPRFEGASALFGTAPCSTATAALP
jgi:copper(I)-binding protein